MASPEIRKLTSEGMLIPFYFCVDVSFSMEGDKLEAANGMIPSIVDEASMNPALADKIRICMIEFSDSANVLIPLQDVRDLAVLPILQAKSGTSFGTLFRLLRSQLETDIRQLKDDGYLVYRPVVFVLTDGEPTDEWRGDFERLTQYDRRTGHGFRFYPVIVPFGIGDADTRILHMLAFPKGASRVFLAADGYTPAASIKAMAELMTASVVQSAASIGGGGGFVLPSTVDFEGVDEADSNEWM